MTPAQLARLRNSPIAECVEAAAEIDRLTAALDAANDDALKEPTMILPYSDELADDAADVLAQIDGAVSKPRLGAQPAQQPIARVAGYHGGHCIVVPTDPAMALQMNMALYAAPQPADPAPHDAYHGARDDLVLAPRVPTEAMWGGLARDIMMWMDLEGRKTPRSLFTHLERCGQEIPQWLRDEQEMKNLDHVPSKGTRAVLIYTAMIEAATKEKP